MTARRNRPKRAVTQDMAHEVLSDDVSNEDMDEDTGQESAADDAVRRPIEPAETKGLWGRVEQGARIAASIGVAGAAIVGVIEYISANEDVRRERALAIVQNWQEDGQIDRYTRLQSFVEAKRETTTPLPADMPPELLARAYQNLGYNWMVDLRAVGDDAARGIEEDVDRLTLFFAQMETCVSADLCNAEVLRAYFGTEARSFWQYFQGYAQLRRENNYPAYGAPVSALVARFEAMDAE